MRCSHFWRHGMTNASCLMSLLKSSPLCVYLMRVLRQTDQRVVCQCVAARSPGAPGNPYHHGCRGVPSKAVRSAVRGPVPVRRCWFSAVKSTRNTTLRSTSIFPHRSGALPRTPTAKILTLRACSATCPRLGCTAAPLPALPWPHLPVGGLEFCGQRSICGLWV
jgi:hypothetical protein